MSVLKELSLNGLATVGFIIVCFIFGVVWFYLSQWLKGSQKNYHWQNGAVETSTKRLNRDDGDSWSDPTIELVRRPFRKLSVSLHDSRWYPLEWRIGRPHEYASGDTVSLTSDVFAESAIQIFGSYRSLQAMLSRIAELEVWIRQKDEEIEKFHKLCIRQASRIIELEEGQLNSDARFQNLLAAVVVLQTHIRSTKPGLGERVNGRYRSKVVQEIREDLEQVIMAMNATVTDMKSLQVWEDRFQKHFLKMSSR